MYHSITFIASDGTRRNTWSDWNLIPSSKPTFQSPEPEERFVDIPGRNGSIDLSEYLTGGVTYKDRSGSFEFLMMHTDIVRDWDNRCNAISKFIHGKKLKVILDDDPMYYYEGRFTFSNKNTGTPTPKVTINYRVGPYKKHITSGNTAF